MSEVKKETERRGAKLAMLKEVRDEIAAIKKYVAKLLSTVTKTRKFRLAKHLQTRQRKVKMELLQEPEKSLD